jgi:type IV pilus assembly protein PilV
MKRQHGATLIEILVTIVIVAFGLLGLAGLQVKMQASETEAYQRSQALMLLNDMANRIANNRLKTASYVGQSIAPDTTCSDYSGSTQADTDLKEWCNALQGVSEKLTEGGSTINTGAMINGRGCITSAADGDVVVTVVWQGLTPVSAPPSSVTCGSGQYNHGTVCVSELCRRFLTTVVRIGTLT